MEFSKLPVAKRTRSSCDRYIEKRFKRAKRSGARVPVPEADVVSSAEYVVLDEDDDEGLSEDDEKGKSVKSRKCGRKDKKGKKLDKDCHVIKNDCVSDEEADSDVVVMSVFDKGEIRVDVRNVNDDDNDVIKNDCVSDEEVDSDVVVMSVFDKGERRVDVNDDDNDSDDGYVKKDMSVELEMSDSLSNEGCSEESDESYRGDLGKENETIIDDDDDDDSSDEEADSDLIVMSVVDKGKRKVDLDLSDSLPNEGCDEQSDESYRGDDSFRFDHAESSNQLSSNAKSEDKGNGFSRKDGLQIHSLSDTDDGSGREYVNKYGGQSRKNQKMARRRKADKVYSASQILADSLAGEEKSDDESRGKFVKREGGEREKYLKMATRRKADEYLDGVKILGDSLRGKTEALKKLETEKPKYKFWFKDEDEKLVEKSDFDKHVDDLFKGLDMCLTSEQIGSTPMEVDNGDHCKSQTDLATLCSQGIHHLVLDEQIGIICKYCSHVHLEIKHILPTFSKPSSHSRRRGYFVQSECPIYSDYFQDTGAEKHDFGNFNTTGTVWDLVPGTKSSMYEHQREGFEFIWKNLAGGIIIEELEKSLPGSGSGCIISHAPGTGKTRLTIVFLQSFMKLYPDSRPVIIAPKSMLLTWEEEFQKWNINIPFHNMNKLEFSGQENPAAVIVSKKIRGSRNNNKNVTRLVKILSWKMKKSILGITYALFDKLVGGATRNADCTPIVQQMGEALLELPSLIVLDEGHTPRNDQSCLYNSLLDVETKRRIILSGTPFQNNFTELYNTMCLVNPKSESDDKMKKKLRKISKEIQSKGSREKLRELKCMISPFVHVHEGNILQKSCPGLKDALIFLHPTDLQQELIALLSTNELNAGHLELSHVISLVSVHPSLLPEHYFHKHQFSAYRARLERLKRDPYSGAKTKFVVELCRLSEALNEKVLIYSQYIDPLIFTKKLLQTYFGWTEGREVLYMDGGLEAKQRQSSINSLNDPRSKVRVLLASIKACSEGIHLVGASRVVLLDVVWNPSVERQAISRAYRLGQKKMVYTYHLIAEEMEIKKYKAQTAKDQLSEMVFSSKDLDSCKINMPDIVSEDKILQEMFQHNDKLGGMFKQIIYQPKESNLVDTFDLVADK